MTDYRAIAEQLVWQAMEGDDRAFQTLARELEKADIWSKEQQAKRADTVTTATTMDVTVATEGK